MNSASMPLPLGCARHALPRRLTTFAVAALALLTAGILASYVWRLQTAQQGAKRSEQSLLAFLRETNTAIIEVDRDSNIVGWNGAAKTVFGFEAQEIVEQPLTRILASDEFGSRHTELVHESFDRAAHTHSTYSLARTKEGKQVAVAVRVFIPASTATAVVIVNRVDKDSPPPLPPPHGDPRVNSLHPRNTDLAAALLICGSQIELGH